MSAQDHLSQKQFEVHRGIMAVDPHQWEEWTGEKTGFRIQEERLGTHWSTEPSVARRFVNGPGSAIFHGTVSQDSIMTDKAEQSKAGADDIHGEYADEREVPLRKGSTINVHSVEKIKDKRTRTRRYNPPRKMKA